MKCETHTKCQKATTILGLAVSVTDKNTMFQTHKPLHSFKIQKLINKKILHQKFFIFSH